MENKQKTAQRTKQYIGDIFIEICLTWQGVLGRFAFFFRFVLHDDLWLLNLGFFGRFGRDRRFFRAGTLLGGRGRLLGKGGMCRGDSGGT
jgi:hypothetical protein